MSNQHDRIETLKFKFKLAMNRRVKNEKKEIHLREAERSLNEEMSLVKIEQNFILQQLEEVKNEISKTINHITMIEICGASEKARIDSFLNDLNTYTNNFDLHFEKEREISEIHNKQAEEKEAKQAELERQKQEKIQELNEQKAKQAVTIESECDAIERECFILKKRNKAIMLKTRRKLIEAEETRRTFLAKMNKNK